MASGRVHSDYIGLYVDRVTKAEARLIAARQGQTISDVIRALIAREAAKPLVQDEVRQEAKRDLAEEKVSA
jgi:hypothetical protein